MTPQLIIFVTNFNTFNYSLLFNKVYNTQTAIEISLFTLSEQVWYLDRL